MGTEFYMKKRLSTKKARKKCLQASSPKEAPKRRFGLEDLLSYGPEIYQENHLEISVWTYTRNISLQIPHGPPEEPGPPTKPMNLGNSHRKVGSPFSNIDLTESRIPLLHAAGPG